MNIKHSDFPSFLFHSSTSLLISFLFSFPSLPFPSFFFFLFISGNFDCHVISVHPTASWRFQLHRALHYRASHRIFIAYLWFSEGEPRKIVNGRWGKRVNWIIKFFDSSRLFHCRHRTGSVERFRNNVDTEIQRFWLKYIYICIRVLWDWKFLFFTLTLRKLEDVTVRPGIDSIGGKCTAYRRILWMV